VDLDAHGVEQGSVQGVEHLDDLSEEDILFPVMMYPSDNYLYCL